VGRGRKGRGGLFPQHNSRQRPANTTERGSHHTRGKRRKSQKREEESGGCGGVYACESAPKLSEATTAGPQSRIEKKRKGIGKRRTLRTAVKPRPMPAGQQKRDRRTETAHLFQVERREEKTAKKGRGGG